MYQELPTLRRQTVEPCRNCDNGFLREVSTGNTIPCPVCGGSGVVEVTRITRTIVKDVPINKINCKNQYNYEPKQQ